MTRPHCLQPDACTAAKPTTHCRRCATHMINSSPEMQERRLAGIRRKLAEPEFREGLVERAKARLSEVRERRGPEWLKQQGRALHVISQTPEVQAKRRAVDHIAGASRANRVLAWCPPQYREQYRFLVRGKAYSAAEARALVEAQIAHDANEGRRIVARIEAEMRAKQARSLAQAY